MKSKARQSKINDLSSNSLRYSLDSRKMPVKALAQYSVGQTPKNKQPMIMPDPFNMILREKSMNSETWRKPYK